MSRILKLFSQNKKSLILILGLGLFLSLVPLSPAEASPGMCDAPTNGPETAGFMWQACKGYCDAIAPWTKAGEATACVVQYVVSLPIRFAALMTAIPLALIAAVTGVLYTIIILILGWLKVIALSVPILPSQVDVVRTGWEITRNLANMSFALILVFIGLATILRIKEYEAKKLLPILIIVALLINFSPVIVGFIVDVSNIIANFFLNLGGWEGTVMIWSMIGNYFLDSFAIMTKMGDIWDVIGYIIGTLVLGIVLIAFFAYSAWIYFLVVALLVVRIIALWVLMILSPFAFLLYVLPAGRKLAREWWQELIKWSIIAIPIGFFLFLSFKVLEASVETQIGSFFKTLDLSGEVEKANVATSTVVFGNFTSQLANTLGMMLVPLVSIVILHIGYKLSRRYMPATANQIIGGIEKGFKMAAGVALVAATGGAAAGLAVKGLGGMVKVAQKMESFAGKAGFKFKIPKGVPKIGGKEIRPSLGWGIKPTSWATRGVEMAAKPYLEKQAARLQKINVDKEMRDRGIEDDAQAQADYAHSPLLSQRNKLQVYSWMGKKGTLQSTSDEEKNKAVALAEKFAGDTHFKKEVGNVLNTLPNSVTKEIKLKYELAGIKDPGEIERKTTEIQDEIDKIQDEFSIKGQPGAEGKATAILHARSLNPRDITGVDKSEGFGLRSESFQLAMQKMSSVHLQALQNNFNEKTIRAVLDENKGLNNVTGFTDTDFRRVEKENPRLVRWSSGTPAGREMLNWSRFTRTPERPTPEEGITKLQEQMTKLRTEIAKPYSALPSDERTELRKRQAKGFKELNIKLTELQERRKGERLTPEELATEAVKGALEEVRKEKRAAALPSIPQLENRVNEIKISIEKMDNEYRALRKAKALGFKERAEGLSSHIDKLKEEMREVGSTIKQAKKVSGKKKPEKTS